MAYGVNWSWEETLMAFALYKIIGPSPSKKDPDVIALANALDRTVDSVCRKISNISAKDKNRIAMGRKGSENGSRYDRIVWEKYEELGDDLLSDSLNLLTKTIKGHGPSGRLVEYSLIDFREGSEAAVITKRRINQDYFRRNLLKNYSKKCCITDLGIETMLVASHIKPWSKSDPRTERLAASNGLLLNAFHDRAFDKGLITIDTNHIVRVSHKVKKNNETEQCLWAFNGQPITLPTIHPPAKEFIDYHNDLIFLK